MAVSMLVERGQVISLISATAETFDAEDVGGEAIADCLGVKPPVSWPPEHDDPATRDWMRGLLADHPDEPGYVGWYMIVQNRLVGVCGFKGPPNIWGEVEIGYSVVEAEHRKGYGVEAAGLLVARAFRDPRVSLVTAETMPARIASQKVLARCGFTHVGGYFDPEQGQLMRFEVRRPG
ncbi:GNAT family N-acetyltransferase [Caulobacter sp. ErkDOM-YI]|uniref:GNAT family N-acetyltransferase n=1 Tax=unclassified Caulobacter TaxID=2648921 RepID=UPI003AF77431